MTTTVHQHFANLADQFLAEVSTSLDIVGKQPGGAEVIKNLHQSAGLAHDINYAPVPKIAWSELKSSYNGAWVIIQGDKGTGAIRASGGTTGTYEALASSGGEVFKLRDGRGGNILDFLKGHIGNLQKFYVGKNTGSVQTKQRNRQELNQQPAAGAINQDTLIIKFKPLWVKAMDLALGDVKGMAQTMLKNDAFDKANRKIEQARNLVKGIEAVQNGESDIPSAVKAAVQSGILMAAAHYYPEETGEITRSRYGGGGLSVERDEGKQKLLADIAAGDTSKLGTILAFFKRSLISG